jgi:cytochrome P450
MLLDVRDPRTGRGLNDAQVRDEAIAMYTTGNAVIASALLWTWYVLSEHNDVATRLQDELAVVLGGRMPTGADLDKLTYTRMVISESMRLFPPAWTIGRRVVQECVLDGTVLPAGALLVLSPFVTQRDARFFPAPEVFDPERWLPPIAGQRPAFAYFPFSGGTRSCLGEQFAWLELMLLVATIAQRGRLRVIPDHTLKFRPLIALRPKGGMRMRWQRSAAASGWR